MVMDKFIILTTNIICKEEGTGWSSRQGVLFLATHTKADGKSYLTIAIENMRE